MRRASLIAASLLLCGLAPGAFAQSAPAEQAAPVQTKAGEVVFPRGASVGLVPPKGMVESSSFSGFEDPARGAAILMVEMPPQAYDEVANGFTDAALATKGILAESRSSLPLGDVKNVLVIGRQHAGGVVARKWILVAGAPTSSALITVQEPAVGAAALSDDEVRAMLSTITFRKPPSPEEQAAALPFKIEDRAGFRLVKVIGNTAAVLTKGDKDMVEGAAQPIFVIGVGPGAPREEERQQFAMRAFSSVPAVKDLRIERAEPLRIGNQPGFEIMASGKDAASGADVKVVQWIRFGGSAFIRMLGIVKASDFADDYTAFRTIRDGVASN